MDVSSTNPIINDSGGRIVQSYKTKPAFTYLKWGFSFTIAFLPIFFNILISAINSNFCFETLWEISGEIMIVSIVIVSEPLWELINLSKKMDLLSVGLIVVKLIFIIFCVFIFTLTLSNKSSDSSTDTPTITHQTNISTDKNLNTIYRDSAKNNITKITQLNIYLDKHAKVKIVWIAISTFIFAFILGSFTLRHYRFVEGL